MHDRAGEWRLQLSSLAEEADRSNSWPATSWRILKDAGLLGSSIPVEYGGLGRNAVELLCAMEQIATSCLTTAFVLSQREAAIRHLLRGPIALRQRYLPKIAAGEDYATVGLSQLTTSRQHLGPTLRVTELPDGRVQLDGEIPWVTGADQAAGIVAGATLSDGRQLLVVVPRDRLTGMIEPPLLLAALVGSRTSLIHCQNLILERHDILAGPTENVLGKLGGGGLDTSCIAIGLTAAAVDELQREAERRPELLAISERFAVGLADARHRLHALAQITPDPNQTLELRMDCTKLALRSTQACLMVSKGNGFVSPHPAQRWARQALFFLVWSCPKPVAEGVLADLTNW